MRSSLLDTLFYIDDSDDEVFLTELIFETQGIDVTIKHFLTLQAFEIYYSQIPKGQPKQGLLVVDLNMPELRGTEIIRKLKLSSSYRDLTMGICSGSQDPADRKSARDAGALFFVPKPLCVDGLAAICRQVGCMDLTRDGRSRFILTHVAASADLPSPTRALRI